MVASSRRGTASPTFLVKERVPTAAAVEAWGVHNVPTGSGNGSGVAPSSLRLELQQEHILSLSQEVDVLREELAHARQRSIQSDELRERERAEVAASYERMLAEQQAAVRQYEARAACVGTLRLEARKRDNELTAVRQEALAVRQRLATLSRVWRMSVMELEQCLETEVRSRNELEAERVKFAEIHRKKLQSLQREADSRSAEAKKLAEREESAVQAAAVAAARQAERSYEIKAKELKSKTDELVKKERSQHSQQISHERANVERERERLTEIGEANLAAARREAADELQVPTPMRCLRPFAPFPPPPRWWPSHCCPPIARVVCLDVGQAVLDAHQAHLLATARAREVDNEVARASLGEVEASLSVAEAAHRQAAEKLSRQLNAAQQQLNLLKDTERELRLQLTSSRHAHATLSKEHEEHKRAAELEKAAARGQHETALRASRRETEEVRRQADEEVKAVTAQLLKAEETVTKQCRQQAEAERAKLLTRHKAEVAKLSQVRRAPSASPLWPPVSSFERPLNSHRTPDDNPLLSPCT